MHDGRFTDLKQVLNYYSSIDEVKSTEVDLQPISLSEQQQQDIINFLQTLYIGSSTRKAFCKS